MRLPVVHDLNGFAIQMSEPLIIWFVCERAKYKVLVCRKWWRQKKKSCSLKDVRNQIIDIRLVCTYDIPSHFVRVSVFGCPEACTDTSTLNLDKCQIRNRSPKTNPYFLNTRSEHHAVVSCLYLTFLPHLIFFLTSSWFLINASLTRPFCRQVVVLASLSGEDWTTSPSPEPLPWQTRHDPTGYFALLLCPSIKTCRRG